MQINNKLVIGFVIFVIICFISINDTIREAIKSMIVHTPSNGIAVFDGDSKSPHGIINFTEDLVGKSVVVDIDMRGFTQGVYALHVHENGNINNLGGHYNPHGSLHGDIGRGHVGDLGNVVADEHGNIRQKIVSRDLKLNGPYSIYGRAIVIRDEPDDFEKGENGSVAAVAVISVAS